MAASIRAITSQVNIISDVSVFSTTFVSIIFIQHSISQQLYYNSELDRVWPPAACNYAKGSTNLQSDI